ncbi:MAG: hypothetical protein ACI4U9_02425, partial [Clostridia bacterium]
GPVSAPKKEFQNSSRCLELLLELEVGAELLFGDRTFLHFSAIEATVMPMGSSPLGRCRNHSAVVAAGTHSLAVTHTENFFCRLFAHMMFLQTNELVSFRKSI